MNNKVNYTFVGFIVLFGFFVLGIASYWMLKPSNEQQVKNYVIYFDESVFGLNLDAPVKFRGISVGKVANLRINPNNSEQVEVQVSILKDTPIKENIVAVLTAQGITGLTYINLTIGRNYEKQVVEIEDKEFQVIATAPSFFKNIEDSLGSVSERMTKTLHQTEKLLDDKNQEKFMELVSGTAQTINRIGEALDPKTIQHFQNSMANLETALANVEKLVDNTIVWENNISASLYGISQSYKRIDASMTEFKGAIESGQFNIKEITADLIPTMNATLTEMQTLMIKMDETLKHYDRSPSDILYKSEEIKKGPGEK